MLRKLRIFLAVVCFVVVTLLFLDFTGTLHAWFGWLAKLQFLPAALAGSVGIVIAIVVVTLLVGRIYCSVVCPLGVMQDGFNWLGGRLHKNRHHYTHPMTWLRWTAFGLFVLLMVLGLNGLALLLAPYSAYGRIAASLLQPVWLWINNLLATVAERADSYAFYHVDVWLKSGVTLAVALVTLILVGFLSFRGGRTWCNTVCPVGTVLGLVSRFSLLKPVIDTSKCNGCQKCARNCKASCIDPEIHTIDYSRCVACMDCLDNCNQHAITFSKAKRGKCISDGDLQGEHPAEATADMGRRQFIAITALTAAATTIKAQEKTVDGGLAVIEDKQIPTRTVPVRPAGSLSRKHFENHCTACQLCVSACPNHVLRPSSDLTRLMQPEMSFERGYCRPECTRCADACPTGAIRRIDAAEKSNIHIGLAVVVAKNCVVNTDGVNCGNCARHCPADAIVMVPKNPGDNPDLPMTLKVPTVDENRCIGCGACENLCPARPFSAIYVEGRDTHIND